MTLMILYFYAMMHRPIAQGLADIYFFRATRSDYQQKKRLIGQDDDDDDDYDDELVPRSCVTEF